MTVRQRPSKKAKNGYCYEVCVRYEENGIKKMYTKRGFNSKKEAQEHEALIRAQIQSNGKIKKECTLTLKQVFDEFMLIGSTDYQSNTMYNTKKDLHYFEDTLGKMLITRIDYVTLQDFFNNRQNVGIETNRNIKKTLNRIFIHALKCGYITQNPLDLVNVRGIDNSKEKKVISFNDFQIIIDELESIGDFKRLSYAMALKIAFYTGLRVSEALALNKRDFDLYNNTITVDKKLVYLGLKIEDYYTTHEMKSYKSKAILPLADILKEDIIKWFNINPYEKVLCDENGNYLNPSTLNTYIKKVSSKLGIEFTYHALRHTYSTVLVTSGVDIKTTQELMRHTNFNTTLSLYTHINNEVKKNTLNSVFDSKRVKNVLNPQIELKSLS